MTASTVEVAHQHLDQAVRLPRIELPTFDGNLLEWESFRDQFRSMVHECPSIGKVQKLLYLQRHLTGSAAELLRNTPITEANYDGAWNSLEARYGNKRILSNFHMNSLINLQPAQKRSSTEIKRLLDFFQQSRRSFTSLGKDIKNWDEWFYFLLIQKLDSDTRLDWETSLKDSSTVPKFTELSTYLENRQQALQSLNEVRSGSSENSKIKLGVKDKSQSDKTQKSLVNSYVANSSKQKPVKCPMCSKPHFLMFCPNFKILDPNSRKETAKKLHVCFNCLKVGHFPSSCKSKFRCLNCSGMHHTLIHEASSGSLSSSNNKSTVNLNSSGNSTAQSVSNDVEIQTPSQQFVGVTRSTQSVLLATAQVLVFAPNGKNIIARALLDTGADVSIISEWVVQSLSLTKKPVNVSISSIQNNHSINSNYSVEFSLGSRINSGFRSKVSAIIIKKLNFHVPSCKIETCGLEAYSRFVFS